MRIGTRGSALALAQAGWVAGRLGPDSELVEITTSGDRARAGDKSRWVSELEVALLEGRIDIAVHSAKDVPTDLAEGLELVAITPRADPRDALCGAGGLAELAPGARVGTSSLRRAAQLRARRPDLEVAELRGNVDTRLRKLASGDADAIVLAAAGLTRLGRQAEIGATLDELVPAAGQGALAIEAAAGFGAAALAGVHDAEAAACVHAERDLVARLGASCNTPVGAHAQPAGQDVELRGWVGLPDGSTWIEDVVRGPAGQVGELVAERLLAVGAAELLQRAEQAVAP
ncbi:MAG TPA: hydroxymethylbilane synthase [Solirubrobacteraceae bacterium]|nr:hydroxymethylbilane synthase [Solirubrobacteraceae bacterium]